MGVPFWFVGGSQWTDAIGCNGCGWASLSRGGRRSPRGPGSRGPASGGCRAGQLPNDRGGRLPRPPVRSGGGQALHLGVTRGVSRQVDAQGAAVGRRALDSWMRGKVRQESTEVGWLRLPRPSTAATVSESSRVGGSGLPILPPLFVGAVSASSSPNYRCARTTCRGTSRVHHVRTL